MVIYSANEKLRTRLLDHIAQMIPIVSLDQVDRRLPSKRHLIRRGFVRQRQIIFAAHDQLIPLLRRSVVGCDPGNALLRGLAISKLQSGSRRKLNLNRFVDVQQRPIFSEPGLL